MREIKFRVWNGGEMIYDVTTGRFGTFYVNPGDKGNGLDEKDSASLTPFNTKYPDSIPVMQYTGLKDKNWKEIYEGDVAIQPKWVSVGQYLPSTGIVKYLGVRFTVDCIGNWKGAYAELDGNCEVIGNIYENPELLTQTL